MEGDRYPVVKITQKFRDTLSEQERVLLTEPAENVPVMQKDIEGDFDRSLFEILRSLRTKLAAEEGVPPFIIFYDLSLKAMATYFPQSLSDLRKISDVGESKLEKYGDFFLEEIVAYCKEHNIEQKHLHCKKHLNFINKI